MTHFTFLLSIVSISAALTNASHIVPKNYTGMATYSEQGLGACGRITTDSELVVGVSEKFFNSWPGYNGKNPNKNPICLESITAWYKGKTVNANITDMNIGAGKYDLNFSPAAFTKLGPEYVGSIHHIKWCIPHAW